MAKTDTTTAITEDNFSPEEVGAQTAAAKTVEAHNPVSKSELLKMLIGRASGLSFSQLNDLVNQSVATIDAAGKGGPDNAEANKASVEMKPSAASPAIREDIAKLFEGQTDEYIEKASVLFEAAVNLRVSVETVRIQEENEAEINEAVEANRTDLIEKINVYLTTAANEWLEENRVAVENTLRSDYAEDTMVGLKNFFADHWVELPSPDKVDILTAAQDRAKTLEDRLNESEKDKIALKTQIANLSAESAFRQVAEGLTLMDIEKFKILTESFDFDGDVEAFRTTLQTVKDANFKPADTTKTAPAKPLREEVVLVTGEEKDGVVITENLDSSVNGRASNPATAAMAALIPTYKRMGNNR